jgi:quercetin dioxygenase-like cupin family protein
MDRRTLLEAFGALALQSAVATAQNAPTPSRGVVFEHDLPDLNIKGWAVTVVEVHYGPSAGSAAHRHPGITLAYVLEGEVVSKVGDGPETTYSVGQMFIETPNELHGVSRNASTIKPARLLAMLLAEKGKQLTTPAV